MNPSSGLKAVNLRAMEHEIPLTAYLELTHSCPLDCSFCCTSHSSVGPTLPFDHWCEVLDDLRRLGTMVAVLTGGDPLIHPDFFKIAQRARELKFALRIMTSGAPVDARGATAIADLHPLAVEMSLHGPTAESHDGVTRSPGSYASLASAVGLLRDLGVRMLLKAPLTQVNASLVPEMENLAELWQVPLRIDPVLTPRNNGDRSPLASVANTAAVRGVLKGMGETAMQDLVVDREPGGRNCGLGRTTLAVDPSGDVFPCIQWRNGTLGNVRESRLLDLWKESNLRKEVALVAQRANDRLIEIGGPASRHPFCPAVARQITGDATQPDQTFFEHARMAEELRGGSP